METKIDSLLYVKKKVIRFFTTHLNIIEIDEDTSFSQIFLIIITSIVREKKLKKNTQFL